MKHFLATVAFSFVAATASAQDAPDFIAKTYPEHALGTVMEWRSALGGEEAALEAKTRELIALGVAAQIPCAYCVYAHTKFAREAGASEAEIREAVAMAADVRHWSTVLNGMNYDMAAFKQEVDGMVPGN